MKTNLEKEIESKNIVIDMLNNEVARLESLLHDGEPIGCHVEEKSVIGDKCPLSFEIVCESDSIAQICAKILNDGFLTLE